MPDTISEELSVYLPSRHRTVFCRLLYLVTPLRDGLKKFFLLKIEELE